MSRKTLITFHERKTNYETCIHLKTGVIIFGVWTNSRENAKNSRKIDIIRSSALKHLNNALRAESVVGKDYDLSLHKFITVCLLRSDKNIWKINKDVNFKMSFQIPQTDIFIYLYKACVNSEIWDKFLPLLVVASAYKIRNMNVKWKKDRIV